MEHPVVIPIDIRFALPCLPRTEDASWKGIAEAVASNVRSVTRLLGIPDEIGFDVTTRNDWGQDVNHTTMTPGLTIQVGDVSAYASATLLRSVWLAFTPDDRPDADAYLDAMSDRLREEDAAQMAASWANYAAEVTRSLLLARAAGFFMPCLVTSGPLGGLASEIGRELLEDILTLLLQCGVSPARPGLAAHIRSVTRSGHTTSDIPEHVYACVRDHAVAVLMNPADFERLLGAPPERGVCRTLVGPSSDATPIDSLLELMVEGMFHEIGVRIPPLRFSAAPHVAPGLISLRVNDFESAPLSLISSDAMLVRANPSLLRAHGINAKPTRDPVNASIASIVPVAEKDRLGPGLSTWDARDYLVLVLSVLLRRAASAFIDVDLVDYELGDIAEEYSELVLNALERRSPAFLASLLRRLVEDRISVRNMRAVLEGICGYSYVIADATGSIVLDDRLIVDQSADDRRNDSVDHNARFVRKFCKRHITSSVSGGSFSMAVRLLPTDLEREVIEHLRWSKRGAPPADPTIRERQRRIAAAIRRATLDAPWAPAPIILTLSDAVAGLRMILNSMAEDVTIIAYDELAPETRINVVEPQIKIE